MIACALALALPAAPAAAKPSCDGKTATIVSNAASIAGTKAPDVIVAGPGDNTIHGEGGNDTICAGAGNDDVDGGRGKDSLFGEEGDDVIHGERGSDRLDGGDGADHVFGDSGNDEASGGDGDRDSVFGDEGDDSVSGGAGSFDDVIGGPGNDHVDGGPGDHDIASYAGTGGAVTVDLGSGNVSGAEGEHLDGIEDTIGGSGADTLIGASGSANRLDGGPGDDRLQSAGGGDEAFGGPGSDDCGGGFAAETSCGKSDGAGGTAVELYGSIDGSTSLIVSGGSGPDAASVNFNAGVFTVVSEPGGDEVTLGDPSSDACVHTISSPSVSCRGDVDTIIASLGPGNDTFRVGDSVAAGVSTVADGGKGSDTIGGGAGSDTLYAGEDADPDTLEGGGGDDVLYGVNIFHPRKDSGAARMVGGAGNDLMIGGQPCDGDSFDGGAGDNDSASFARVHNSGVFVEATIGGAVLDPDAGGCNVGSIDPSTEKIEGSPGPDVLNGDDAANKLLGRGGNDRLDGHGGSDECIGGGGNDQLNSCESGG
ncbi:MAG: calcium-binding protein [Solirubrobacterales bacterium]